MINFELSKEQFKTLLELIYLGNIMANEHREQDIEEYNQLQEHLFSLAPECGINDCSDLEEPQYPSNDLEEELQEITCEYNEASFWEELIKRLSTMKLLEVYTPEHLNNMESIDQFKLVLEYEGKIRSHLAQFGLAQFPLPE